MVKQSRDALIKVQSIKEQETNTTTRKYEFHIKKSNLFNEKVESELTRNNIQLDYSNGEDPNHVTQSQLINQFTDTITKCINAASEVAFARKKRSKFKFFW